MVWKVLITNVLRDGAARKAGIERFDIITNVNDVPVNSVSQLHEQVIKPV